MSQENRGGNLIALLAVGDTNTYQTNYIHVKSL